MRGSSRHSGLRPTEASGLILRNGALGPATTRVEIAKAEMSAALEGKSC